MYKGITKNYSREDRDVIENEISRRIEGYRLNLTDIVSRDDKLWSMAERYIAKYNLGNLSKDEFKSLPRMHELNNVGISYFFSEFENEAIQLNNNSKMPIMPALDDIIKARNQLVEMNIPLAISMLPKFSDIDSSSRNDILQEGIVGLIKAAHRYDHKRGVKFSTYAGLYMYEYMSRATSRSSTIYVPRKELNIGEIERKNENLANVISLEAMYEKNGEINYPSNDNTEEHLIHQDFFVHVRSLLPKRTALMWDMRCGDVDLKDIGKRFGMTRQGATHILTKDVKHAIGVLNQEKRKLRLNKDVY